MHFRLQAAIFDITLTLTYESLPTSTVMLLNPKNIYKAVWISFLSCIQAQIHFILYPLPVIDRDSLIFHSPGHRTVLTVVPLCCASTQNMQIPLKFHIHSICNFRYKYFRFRVRHFISGWKRIEFCTGRFCYHQRWRRHRQKQTQERLICCHRWFTPFDSMVSKIITFTKKSSTPPSLRVSDVIR